MARVDRPQRAAGARDGGDRPLAERASADETASQSTSPSDYWLIVKVKPWVASRP
jgi:hypothetical protein